MEPRAVLTIVDAIAEAGVTLLAGVNGDAATAASFAGQWSERRKSAATPFQGTRLYELLELGEVPAARVTYAKQVREIASMGKLVNPNATAAKRSSVRRK